LKLDSKLYQDSKIVAKLSCGWTKPEAFVTNVPDKKALVLTDGILTCLKMENIQ